ncbi:hypothetical protein L596_019911 [Steinernema carpocapsae]|uniref:Uncharacterized protein n=1 Tax=Steinernema carpocapsae TaxID=34508 RepID=A0A4U5MS46_STECR|nr:hypothetical protein L596_019911 [Steinernema carpocapsae]
MLLFDVFFRDLARLSSRIARRLRSKDGHGFILERPSELTVHYILSEREVSDDSAKLRSEFWSADEL